MKRGYSSDSSDSVASDKEFKSPLASKAPSAAANAQERRRKAVGSNNCEPAQSPPHAAISGLTTPLRTPVVVLHRLTPGTMVRKSLGGNVPVMESAGAKDATHERQERLKNRIVAQRKSLGPQAPVTDAQKNLNPTQLKEHYSVCIKLSAANKINMKNAFDLLLIDYLSYFTETAADGHMNFKIASSTLDAGAKIYCNRVDYVHSEAQKVASGLVMALDTNKKSSKHNGDNIDSDIGSGNDERMDDDENDANPKPKKKKTTKKVVKTIAQNLDQINASKLETSLEIDPMFHHISSADMGSVISLLMANLKRNHNYELLLDSNFPGDTPNSEPLVPHPKAPLEPFINSLSIENDQICPKTAQFEFSKRDDGLDIAGLSSFDQASSVEGREETTAGFVFDMNADVEDVESEDNDGNGMYDGIFTNDGDDPCNPDDEGYKTVTKKSMLRAVNLEAINDILKVLSDKPSEYSYFNRKLISTWAGPNHWKANPFLRFKNKPETEKPTETKTKSSRRKFSEYNFEDESVLFSTEILKPAKLGTLKLKLETLKKWKAENSLLPHDYGYDPKLLTVPFNKPDKTFGLLRSKDDVPEANLSDDDDDRGHFDTPLSPGGGLDFGRNDDYEDDVPPSGDLFDTASVNPTGTNGGLPFAGDNLVEQPYCIQQTLLPYTKIAKKMDVKRLKRAMWDVLNASVEPVNNNTSSPTPEPPVDPSPKLTFSDLYKNVPEKITPLMVNNLSAPIAFVALLHLANEKSLSLVGKEDLTDFVITQGSCSPLASTAQSGFPSEPHFTS